MSTITATAPTASVHNGKKLPGHIVKTLAVVVFHDGAQHEAARAIVHGTSSANSAVVAILDPMNRHRFVGTGKASGYGYHRTSQALADAMESAGFKLSQEVGGTGIDAAKRALLACVAAAGWDVMHHIIVEI